MKRKIAPEANQQQPFDAKRLKTSSGPFYAVKVGRTPGIYTTWKECEEQVHGFKGARYKKFPVARDALVFFGLLDTNQHLNLVSLDEKPTTTTPSFTATAATTTIWTDGACKNNGKTNAKAGIGIYFKRKGGEPSVRTALPLNGIKQTNQRAELAAALLGLQSVCDQKESAVTKEIELITDSTYVVEGMNSWMMAWKRAGWTKELTNMDLWRALEKISDGMKENGFTIHWKWCKGHSGVKGNDEADALANEGCKMQSKTERK